MNDLRVENYGEKDVETKKQSIKKRAAAAGGAIVLTLGLFSLMGCDPEHEPERTPPGGNGAWFCSYPEPCEETEPSDD